LAGTSNMRLKKIGFIGDKYISLVINTVSLLVLLSVSPVDCFHSLVCVSI